MYQSKFQITLKGVTPLLMHKDNLKWGERIKLWTSDPANKKTSVAGDDRTPAWTWLGYMYHNDGLAVIDCDNLMSMFRDAGKKCPSGKGKATLKTATQSGIMVDHIGWPVAVAGGAMIDAAGLLDQLKDCNDFTQHEEAAQKAGFELFVKRARIGQSKHVRVRPRFDTWSATGTITVLDETLTEQVLVNLLNQGGRFVGLCDWRPGSPSASGQFGMFTHEIQRID